MYGQTVDLSIYQLIWYFHCSSMHYAKLAAAGYKGGLISAPAVGDFCCAKFSQDDTWYRALVTALEESDKGLIINPVFYHLSYSETTPPRST